MTTANDNDLDPAPKSASDSSELEQSSRTSASEDDCFYCPTGSFEPGETTMTLERSGTTLVVKRVPGQVCWACGEALLTEDTVGRLQEMMERAVTAGVETAVRDYPEEETSATADESSGTPVASKTDE
jgi:YgiT-type zinc finger domain-containing protein